MTVTIGLVGDEYDKHKSQLHPVYSLANLWIFWVILRLNADIVLLEKISRWFYLFFSVLFLQATWGADFLQHSPSNNFA
jgi:hypothetical protein